MNPTDTKERIIFSSFNLFFNKGYKDVSLQDISKSVGITKGGFYHYYKSKEELFIEMMEVCYFNYMESLIVYLKDKTTGFKEKLKKVMYFYYDEFATKMVSKDFEAGGFYVMLIDGLRKFDILRIRLKNLYKKIETAIKASIKNEINLGIIKEGTDADLLTFEILSLIEGSFILWIINNEINVKNKIEKVFNSIINRIYK
jgi:AcrR family transcriptional regulator